MLDALKALQDTSLPTILVAAGLIFILLSLVGGIAGKIEMPADKQKVSGLIGAVLLVIGVVLYSVPINQNPVSIPIVNVSTVAPDLSVDTSTSEITTKLAILDVIKLESDGTEYRTSVFLEKNSPYTLLVEGSFYFADGYLADAQTALRGNTNSRERTNWVQINDARPEATESDFENRRYIYTVYRPGDKLKLRIWDNRYEDNSGSLNVTLFNGKISLSDL